jgi:pyrroloquinoline quinone (PQQ) biosynthesis protein C
MKNPKNQILQEIEEVRTRLLNHKLYKNIKTDRDLKLFMSSHVYAVWDFMSLLKSLQNSLTCTTTPWIPKGDTNLRYLINEIVLAEETDLDEHGKRMSHYEMYLNAMDAAGLEWKEVHEHIIELSKSKDILNQIKIADLPNHVKQFLHTTFSIIQRNKSHEVAAAFTYGREDLIPEMFSEILGGLSKTSIETDLQPITYYFDRHIELDGDDHGPMAHKMVELLCEDDMLKWQEAAAVSKEALLSRIALFDGILEEIQSSKLELA